MKQLIYIALAIFLFAGAADAKTKVQPEQPKQQTAAEIAQEQQLKYYFYQAMYCLDQNRYDETMALLMHCERIAPNDAAVAHNLGVMYGGLEHTERALEYYEKAFRLCPEEYWYVYCVLNYQTGDKNKQQMAIKTLEKIAQELPDNQQVQETLQRMYIVQGNSNLKFYKKAIQQQDRIDAITGLTALGAVHRFQLYQELGQSKKSQKAITDYLRYDPDNYYMQVLLGDVELQRGNHEEAWRQLSNVRKQYPENPYLAISLGNYHWHFGDRDSAAYFERQAIDNDFMDLSDKLTILNDYKWLAHIPGAEEEALKSLVKQYPQEEESTFALAQYHIDNQQLQEAEPLLWTVLDINPQNDKAWQLLLAVYQNDSTTSDEQYETLIRQALVNRPQQKQWYYMMAILQIQKQQPDSAIIYCKEGLQQPEETDLRYKMALFIELGDLYMQQTQVDSAYHYYEAALAYDPENVYVLNNYAYFMAIQGGDLRKAEKMSQRTIKKDPDNPSYLDTYAWILHLQGQEILARFYMQQAWDKTEDKTSQELVEHYIAIFGSLP